MSIGKIELNIELIKLLSLSERSIFPSNSFQIMDPFTFFFPLLLLLFRFFCLFLVTRLCSTFLVTDSSLSLYLILFSSFSPLLFPPSESLCFFSFIFLRHSLINAYPLSLSFRHFISSFLLVPSKAKHDNLNVSPISISGYFEMSFLLSSLIHDSSLH